MAQQEAAPKDAVLFRRHISTMLALGRVPKDAKMPRPKDAELPAMTLHSHVHTCAGARVGHRTSNGISALWMAAKAGRAEVVALLLDAKAEVDALLSDGGARAPSRWRPGQARPSWRWRHGGPCLAPRSASEGSRLPCSLPETWHRSPPTPKKPPISPRRTAHIPAQPTRTHAHAHARRLAAARRELQGPRRRRAAAAVAPQDGQKAVLVAPELATSSS